MSSVVNVAIHRSQFPDAIRRDWLTSLRTRRVNHKFHYDSAKQTQKWLALHQVHSPSRNDTDCAATYDKALAAAVAQVKAPAVHLLGLGCGGGQKDTRLLKLLRARGPHITYTPCDVSTAMVLVAREAALSVVAEGNCFPLVCDLATANDLTEVLFAHHALAPRSDPSRRSRREAEAQAESSSTRLITFFGMIPNFEPEEILPKLASMVRPGDWLLFSANLAPGPDYAAGVQRVLPQYDNPLTHDWLLTFLLDAGVERGDGELSFAIEEDTGGSELKKIVARFHFARSRRIEVEGEEFEFRPGEAIQLFFSYRHTPARIVSALARHRLEVSDSWVTRSEEEGVFLVKRF